MNDENEQITLKEMAVLLGKKESYLTSIKFKYPESFPKTVGKSGLNILYKKSDALAILKGETVINTKLDLKLSNQFLRTKPSSRSSL